MDRVVHLQEVVGALDETAEYVRYFLHLPSQELVMVMDSSYVGDDLSGEQPSEDQLDSGDYLALPDSFDIHEWAIMRAFASQLADPDLSDRLLNAMHGKGAFRYFKDTLHSAGIADDWYAFRLGALEEIAREWLEENGIHYRKD